MTELEAAQFGMKAAALALVDAALRVIEGDPHMFSTRPCQTCRTVSSLVARPFGCEDPKIAKIGYRVIVRETP